MPTSKPKPKSGEGGNFGPSAKETKQTKGNRAVSIAAQKREHWNKQKKQKRKKEWTNYPKGKKRNPSIPSAHRKKHNA